MRNRKPWTEPGDRFDRALEGYEHTRNQENCQPDESTGHFPDVSCERLAPAAVTPAINRVSGHRKKGDLTMKFKPSDEHRRKMSEGMKAYHQGRKVRPLPYPLAEPEPAP